MYDINFPPPPPPTPTPPNPRWLYLSERVNKILLSVIDLSWYVDGKIDGPDNTPRNRFLIFLKDKIFGISGHLAYWLYRIDEKVGWSEIDESEIDRGTWELLLNLLSGIMSHSVSYYRLI